MGKALPEITTEKIKFASKVNLTEKQHEYLVENYGGTNTQQMIEKLNNYKEAKNKNYDSDFHAIKLWVVDSVLNNKKSDSKGIGEDSSLIKARNMEIALTKWIEEGNDPNEFSY